jgi:hypothetical protein
MITTVQNFDRTQGDNYPIRLQVKNNKLPMDITGASITMKVLFSSSITPVSFHSVIIDAPLGIAEFQFTQTSFSEVGSFRYEVEMITSTSIKYTIAKGNIKVTADLG